MPFTLHQLRGEVNTKMFTFMVQQNCGKSFILSPLNVFCNPATGSFAWIGAEDAEIIYLNDFRWHPKIIARADLQLALEGDTVHLPAPKNLSSHDVELQRDTPFFAT